MAASDPTDGGTEAPGDDPSRRSSVRNDGRSTDAPTAVDHLDDAQEALRVERRRLADECQAFASFRSRVREITTDRTPKPAAISTSLRDRTRGTSRGLAAVRDAYRETVMAVPHYETEYNDTYGRSLAAEFGPELATALTRGTSLHGQYRSTLVAKTDEAIRKRESLLDALEDESASVSETATRIESIRGEMETIRESGFTEEGFGALDAYRARLGVLEETCERVSTRRQRDLSNEKRDLGLDDALPDVQSYLYQDLPVTYPVLAAVAETVTRTVETRRAVERAMAHTVTWE